MFFVKLGLTIQQRYTTDYANEKYEHGIESITELGSFDGNDVVAIKINDDRYCLLYERVILGDYAFMFDYRGTLIFVNTKNNLIPLTQAYEDGLLSQENIESIGIAYHGDDFKVYNDQYQNEEKDGEIESRDYHGYDLSNLMFYPMSKMTIMFNNPVDGNIPVSADEL